jgi:hypothetical protein
MDLDLIHSKTLQSFEVRSPFSLYLSLCLSGTEIRCTASTESLQNFRFAERKRAREEDRSGDGGWKGHALSLKRPSLFRPNGKALYF